MRKNVLLKPRHIAVVALTAGLALLLGGQSSANSTRSHDEAIIEVIQTQADAWNRGDLEGFMAGYLEGPDLVFTSGGNVRRGWQITYDKYKESYGTSPETMGKLRFSDLEVHPLGEDSAWVLGRWHLVGSEASAGGVFTLVFQRIDGQWLGVHDHTRADPTE